MNGIDIQYSPWDLYGIGATPDFFASGGDLMSLPYVQGAQARQEQNMNIWDAIAKVGSVAVNNLLAPTPQVTLPPQQQQLGQQVESILRDFGVAVPFQTTSPILANALPARCATTAGMSGLPCVVHQGGPYKGQLVKSNRRRKVKLMPDGQGGFTPVICCTPRRMNPLNPRALRRAAVRLGRFQHIAHTIEKMVARAVKPRGRSSTRRYVSNTRSSRCLPTRCG